MLPRDLVSYSYPTVGVLLLMIILFAALFWLLAIYREKALKTFFQPSLRHLLLPRSSRHFWLQVSTYSLVWLLAIVALMDPKGRGRLSRRATEKRDSPTR